MTSGVLESIEYRVVLLHRESKAVWVPCSYARCRLPRVSIHHGARPVPQLRSAMQDIWGLQIWILDLLDVGSATPWAVAESPTVALNRHFELVRIDALSTSEFSEEERAQFALVQNGHSDSPLARAGWMDEALAWIETVTRRKVRSRQDVDQVNAGFGFALLRCRLDGIQDCWLKATGAPNAHELQVTQVLSQLGGSYLPSFLASKPAWNAWLMGGARHNAPSLSKEELTGLGPLQTAVNSMAELQSRTAGHAKDLLNAGAFDQRLQAFSAATAQTFEYLETVMERQTSLKVNRLSCHRLRELRNIFEDACGAVDALRLPDCIVHGDMSWDNMVCEEGSCRFLDWAEAYVGNPLITFQHLLLLHQNHEPSDGALKRVYRSALGTICDQEAIDRGFVYMPLLAVYSVLYGRCDGMVTPTRDDMRQQAYARTLARYMDRAAQEPSLLGALKTPSAARCCRSSSSSASSPAQSIGVAR